MLGVIVGLLGVGMLLYLIPGQGTESSRPFDINACPESGVGRPGRRARVRARSARRAPGSNGSNAVAIPRLPLPKLTAGCRRLRAAEAYRPADHVPSNRLFPSP